MDNGKDTPVESSEGEYIAQRHSGTGDNVMRDKNVYQSISPKALHHSILNILTSLRHRQPIQSKEQLNALKATSNLDADAIDILNTIQILVDLSEDEMASDGYQNLNAYIKSSNDEFCNDIISSAQIRLDVKKGNLSDAHERYAKLEYPGRYTNEAYYEFIADKNEIEAVYKKKKLELTEEELCGLVRGSLRVDAPFYALSVAEYTHSAYPSINSEVFITIAQAAIFNVKLDRKHYWSISAKLRKEVINLCDNIINLLRKCGGKDSRLASLAATSLQFVYYEYKPLADICWTYISEIEVVHPEIALQIRLIYEQQPGNLNGFLYKIVKSKKDSVYRNEIITEITNSADISTEDSALLSSIADKASAKKWVDSGGKVLSADHLERDFSILDLRALACDGSRESVENLRSLVNYFIKEHKVNIINVIPPRVLKLSERLIDLGLSSVACELLKPHVPTSDIWVSPIVYCYLNALIDSQQMMTLDATLREINQGDWDVFIWQVKARQLNSQHKYVDAIDAIEQALVLEPLSCYSWYLLVCLHKQEESNEELVSNVLDRIPSELFSHPSELGYRLLAEIAITGDFSKAEEYLIDWFINDPDNCAKPFTNFYCTMALEEKRVVNPKNNVGDCLGGVSYSSDSIETTKLLVTTVTTSHQSLLNISSPLGQLLSSMNVGDVEMHGMQEIKLLERCPPYIAAFTIASMLRQAFNDGSDCFYSFQPPKDSDELFEDLRKKLSSIDKSRKTLDSQPNIPLFMKGYHHNSDNPINAALYHMTERESVKHSLPAFGEENPDQVILDVYSVVYLALTGLVKGLIDSHVTPIISIETKRCIERWFLGVNRDDYFTLGLHQDGGLVRHTADDIRRDTANIQEAFNVILEKSDVISPNLVDIPPEALQLEDVVDYSVFSSLRLSVTNDIPWLCVDSFFAHYAKKIDVGIVNVQHFFIRIGRSLPIKQKQRGLYLHVSSRLPYPLTYEDIIQLSKSEEEHAQYYLAELLKMYPNAFLSDKATLQFLYQILAIVLINAYYDGEILKGLRVTNLKNNGYAEHVFNLCCRISMQDKSGQEAEYKLALLLANILYVFKDILSMNKLIRNLASRFISGHFLNFEVINKHLRELVAKLIDAP